jgi:hypothetical protein
MGEKDQLRAAAQRNILVLAAGMAALYAMVELVFGVATIAFEETGGSPWPRRGRPPGRRSRLS